VHHATTGDELPAEREWVRGLYSVLAPHMITRTDVNVVEEVQERCDREARRFEIARVAKAVIVALDGKVALVTGASRGIGKETAIELARQGADVVVAARTVEPRKQLPGTIGETVSVIESLGRRALAVATDVSKADDLDALVEEATSTMGGVDVLVNNAAYTSGHALTQAVWELSRDDWELQFATNVHAPFTLIKALTPHMRDRGGGVVLNVTSPAAEMYPVDAAFQRNFGGGGAWTYGASKAALNRMTNALAAQLLEYGIAVVALEPGFVRTEFVSLMEERGIFDGSAAIPMSVPARVIAYLADPANARPYTGTVVAAPTLFAELDL
jgi:NAD(P)-dependent dehydrogenase (short-subunit alcohol dehydrogenase family)